MVDTKSIWDDIKRMAQELEVQMHLAEMEARERWTALKPRIGELQKDMSDTGKKVNEVVEKELSSVGAALRKLRDDIVKR
ncbi:MAG TPA: hypothetical protein VMZ53_04155 [Kofleriaceae bacterium]|nr:hypothetical protein [Kofleriaceae bacterium]